MSLQTTATVHPIRRSAAPRSWSDGRDAIRAAVRELCQGHPRAGEQQIGRLLAERLEVDPELLGAGAVYLAHDALTANRIQRGRAAPTPKARAARKIAERAQVRVTVVKAREIILLDMPVTLLSGEQKALRYVTGRELADLGAAYEKIAEKVEPDEMIGERLTEHEVRGLLAAGA
jgi:hypothetical protein